MFRPPEAPSTYQTLQVNCVACQVMFTIAEGTPGAGPDDARPAAAGPADARAGHRDWRLPAAERPYIRYQFRPNTAERETGPVGRPETLGEEAPGGEETAVDAPLVAPRPYVSLNCPRCGADNRNWVALTTPARHATDLPARLQYQWERFPFSVGAILWTGIMMALSFIFALALDHDPWTQWLPLVMTIFLCGSGVSIGITSLWRKMLDRERLRQYLPAVASRGLSPTIQLGLVITAVFAGLVPFVLYAVLPVGATILIDDYQPSFQHKFILGWIGLVAVTGGQATFLASVSVGRYVQRIARHIPPPFYSSISHMTRVVLWEAKTALEVQGANMNHVQWLKIERNAAGGINLTGVQRAAPLRNRQGEPIAALVPAQQYYIESDMWGHLQKARIRDVQVPPSAFHGAADVPPPGSRYLTVPAMQTEDADALAGALFGALPGG